MNDQLVNAINNGLCLLVGLSVDDTKDDIDWMANKLLKIRLFEGGTSLIDNRLEILSISQFTLHATIKGNSLDYHKAMKSTEAKDAYHSFLARLRELYQPHQPHLIKDGKFGEMMQVSILNDGPFTLVLDSKNRK